MRKYVDELTNQELTLVFLSNQKLQEMVRDELLEIENSWNKVVLFTLGKGLRFHNVSEDSPSQININEMEIDTFIKGVKSLQNEGAFILEEEMELIYQLESDFEKYNEFQEKLTSTDVDCAGAIKKELELISSKVDVQIENIELLMETYFDNGYKRIETESYQLDFFLKVYSQNILPQNCFVENGQYTLFEQTKFDYDKGTLESIKRNDRAKKSKVVLER